MASVGMGATEFLKQNSAEMCTLPVRATVGSVLALAWATLCFLLGTAGPSLALAELHRDQSLLLYSWVSCGCF